MEIRLVNVLYKCEIRIELLFFVWSLLMEGFFWIFLCLGFCCCFACVFFCWVFAVRFVDGFDGLFFAFFWLFFVVACFVLLYLYGDIIL